ncbi:hypothetical protein [Kitasatospora sp. NBC_01302]|uniref:hypothetical protein n=1 Tax=Kitasatospora sp. NBC_01302 TaxID=2903575 RepID=UPI002E11D81C|nr:hypothetical protein OG294_09215 [Kitasatospora sp. NBC_01302]
MTRTDMIRLSGYWPNLAKLGMDHPDDVHAMFDAFRDMRDDSEFGPGLDLLLSELFDAPDTV